MIKLCSERCHVAVISYNYKWRQMQLFYQVYFTLWCCYFPSVKDLNALSSLAHVSSHKGFLGGWGQRRLHISILTVFLDGPLRSPLLVDLATWSQWTCSVTSLPTMIAKIQKHTNLEWAPLLTQHQAPHPPQPRGLDSPGRVWWTHWPSV